LRAALTALWADQQLRIPHGQGLGTPLSTGPNRWRSIRAKDKNNALAAYVGLLLLLLLVKMGWVLWAMAERLRYL
jgi:hypothetical protein